MLLRCLLVALFTLSLCTPASGEATQWTEAQANGETSVHLYLFWSLRCPHCLEARPQIRALAQRTPWLQLHEFEISEQPAHLGLFEEMAREVGESAQAVPTLFFCERMQPGWDGSPAGIAHFAEQLEACRAQEKPPGDQTPVIPGLSGIDTDLLSLPLLTVLIAGLDAFNPCAFFVLLFLLSLLVHQRQRGRMLLIGGVFVLTSGLMYFAFMAAWLNLFLLTTGLPWVTAAAGLLAVAAGLINIKDFFAFHQGPSLSIPESRKPGLFARSRRIVNADHLPAMLAATLLLAIAANFYELLCTAGFPMIYTRLLTLRADPAEHYLFLALYNVVYVLPLLAIVLAFSFTMGARKLSEREGRLLKLLSGCMMSGLGALLLLAPALLGHPGVAFGLLIAALLVTWLAARGSSPNKPSNPA